MDIIKVRNKKDESIYGVHLVSNVIAKIVRGGTLKLTKV